VVLGLHVCALLSEPTVQCLEPGFLIVLIGHAAAKAPHQNLQDGYARGHDESMGAEAGLTV
jgi:hypothetical protein